VDSSRHPVHEEAIFSHLQQIGMPLQAGAGCMQCLSVIVDMRGFRRQSIDRCEQACTDLVDLSAGGAVRPVRGKKNQPQVSARWNQLKG
jgi:hypothetical protein